MASLLLLAVLTAGSVGLKPLLGLEWNLHFQLLSVALGLGTLILSDILSHGLLRLLGGRPYQAYYRAFVEYFRPQRTFHIIIGAALAAGEELFFRGILLEGWLTRTHLHPALGVCISAVLFAVAHFLPRRPLAGYALSALWTGILLGGIYLFFGSLLVVMWVHVLHDGLGFSLFAFQRRSGWLL
ncbi:MAG: CPBP family intramembrane glutamic endopeptidase [Planctomycetota bacterium]